MPGFRESLGEAARAGAELKQTLPSGQFSAEQARRTPCPSLQGLLQDRQVSGSPRLPQVCPAQPKRATAAAPPLWPPAAIPPPAPRPRPRLGTGHAQSPPASRSQGSLRTPSAGCSRSPPRRQPPGCLPARSAPRDPDSWPAPAPPAASAAAAATQCSRGAGDGRTASSAAGERAARAPAEGGDGDPAAARRDLLSFPPPPGSG